MSTQPPIQHAKATIGEKMLYAIPGDGGKLDNTSLKHGCAIYRGAKQVAAGYVSDNAAWHAVEFALNQDLLAELPFERAALMRWLEYQRQRFGGREPNIHQRGNPVHWFRIGFNSVDDALTFLREFRTQRTNANVFSRWAIVQREAVDAMPAAPGSDTAEDVLSEVATATVLSSSGELTTSALHEPLAEIERDDWDGAGEGNEGIDEHIGNLRNDAYALACIPVLIAHVLRQTDEVMQKLTYEDLAERMGRLNKHGRPAARGLGVILGKAMDHIDHAAAHMGAPPPYLTTIVVAKSGPDKGLPGVGVRERWHGYDQLTRAEKVDRIEAEYKRILLFGSRWNDVLTALGLLSRPVGETLPPDEAAGGGWGGGESGEHKALKEYVRNHPELFGAGSDDWGWRATEEYALRSGDEIDVFFKSNSTWIGVEVKSAVSDGNVKDYERGLYQVVKYRAVLAAQAKIDYPVEPPTVKVMLALDRALPAQLRAVAQFLEVEIIDNLGLVERHAAQAD